MNEERFSTVWEAISSALAYFFAVLLIVSPIYIITSGMYLFRAVKRNDEMEIQRHLPLFKGKRISSLAAIQHSSVFFMRRYIIIFVLVIYRDYRFLQIQSSMVGALVITLYTIVMRPFEDPILNKQEVVNELALYFAFIMLYAFTEILSNMEQLVICGWISVNLNGAIVLINLVFMSLVSCKTLLLSIKRC